MVDLSDPYQTEIEMQRARERALLLPDPPPSSGWAGPLLTWGIILALVVVMIFHFLPPHEQTNVRIVAGAMAEMGFSAVEHPGIVMPLMRGAIFDEMGVHHRAIFYYSKVLEIDPEFSWGYYVRASTYWNMGQIGGARDDLSRAIHLNPDMTWAYSMRGLVYRDAVGDVKLAMDDFEAAIAAEPDYAWAYVNLGRIHPDPQTALQMFNKALELGLHKPEVYVHRGNTYAGMGDYAAAFADYDAALERDDEFQWVFYYRGRVHEALGDNASALEDYQRFLELHGDPASGDAAYVQGRIAALRGVPADEADKPGVEDRCEVCVP